MRGIILKECVKQFGFKHGFSFWFDWSFIHPIQMFVWLNITHRPYCTWAGFHCKDENCKHKHLLTKEEILKNQKECREEMKKVSVGKDGLCIYCGEEKATIIIPNPNTLLDNWKVCQTCKKIINAQNELGFATKMQDIAKKKLDEISYESGKEVFGVEVRK